MTHQELASATGSKLDKALYWLPYIEATLTEFGITTKLQKAMYLAQIGHETGGLRYTEELWGPTPAQLRYEGRKDLGNTQKGDGYACRGLGHIQTTGRYNMEKLNAAFGVDVINNEEDRTNPGVIARSGGLYWKTHNLNRFADKGDIDGCSDMINIGRATIKYGDSNGFADRKRLYEAALKALPETEEPDPTLPEKIDAAPEAPKQGLWKLLSFAFSLLNQLLKRKV